ncbi:MAG TPA: hypothetical protein VMS56_07345 [Thermoanaerobaculia bacterium]|nr:hypothetical protein [Thermoanaerobaculia bacterium]
MKHARSSTWTLAAVSAALLAACVSSAFPPDEEARRASGTPAAFEIPTGEGLRPARPSDACRSPMVDPRDRTELELIRSQAGRGDYRVPGGRYGVGAGELLRIDCATGAPIGIVAGEH